MNDTCICENTPRVWRLTGVTRTLRLRIFNPDGTPLDLSGRTVAVTIARDNSEFSYAPGFVIEGDDGNVVKFEWPANKQGAGDYTINVTTTDGSGNVDRVNWHGPTGIRLVDFSFMVRGEDALGVTSEANIGLDGTFTMNGTGMSAYDEWLAEGHTGTPEDFIAWLRQPATDAASAAEAQMGQIQERADADHTRAGNDHTTAGQDHTRAGNDHTTATDDHRIAAADHSTATDDHTLAASDHVTAAEDHRVAGIDHGTAADDHTRAGQDHQTASDDHTQAGSDHTRAGEDHTRAGDDHQTASSDHTRAGEDHTTAGSDHTRAGEDHTQAGNDHTRAEADHGIAADDHTQATADHAVMAGYDTRLGNVESEVSQLGQKVDIFNATSPVDYTDDVLEVWLSNMPAGRVCLKCYNNTPYLVSPDTTIYAYAIGTSSNNVPYAFTVYSSSDANYPVGTILGYVMFRDIISFKSKSNSTIWENISRERCENLANSPLIALALEEVKINNVQNAVNATNSVNATNATNVVLSSTEHSAFVKELYLFGNGIDKTHTYEIRGVSRNHTTYKYTIAIRDSTLGANVAVLSGVLSEPNNPVFIPEYNGSGVSAYAVLNWDEFEDGSNNTMDIYLLPRVFDLNYSPIISNYLNIVKIEGIVYQKKEYERGDFYDGYLSTSTTAFGNIVSLPTDSTKVTETSTAGHLTIAVKEGDRITAKYKSVSNKYCRAWIFLDSTRKIISWSNPQSNDNTQETYNYLTIPFDFNADRDGFLIIQFPQANYADNLSLSVVHEYPIEVGVSEKVEVCVPENIYAVVGDTLQLYYRSIFKCVDYTKYNVDVNCNIGSQYPRYYELTPTIENIGTRTITFSIRDNANNVLGTKSANLVVVASGQSPADELNVLCVGASATNGGQWASELKRRLTASGGTPSGSALSNIIFVGRKSVTFDGKQVNLEATGGYQFTSYTDVSTTRYRFNVTAENEPTINVGDVYSNNGNNYTIAEINITAGEGGYFSCTGEGTPQASGTLTKVTGTGSATITYSSTSLSGNPFAYGGVIDMQQYADEYCNPQNAEHGRIDVVYTELYGNDTDAYMTDFSTRLSQMQAFITQIRSVFPNCKFLIGLFWNPDLKGGMGVNYGASGTWHNPYGIKFSNHGLCLALQKYITDNNLSSYVSIVNWLNEFDEENDFMQTTKPVNPRSDVTEIFGVNGVHPATVGYYQMADTAWRLFVAKFCQSN